MNAIEIQKNEIVQLKADLAAAQEKAVSAGASLKTATDRAASLETEKADIAAALETVKAAHGKTLSDLASLRIEHDELKKKDSDLDARATAKAIEIAAAQTIPAVRASTEQKDESAVTKENFYAKYNALKTADERAAFYGTHHKVLTARS